MLEHFIARIVVGNHVLRLETKLVLAEKVNLEDLFVIGPVKVRIRYEELVKVIPIPSDNLDQHIKPDVYKRGDDYEILLGLIVFHQVDDQKHPCHNLCRIVGEEEGGHQAVN